MKTLLQVTYLGQSMPDADELKCMDRTAAYAYDNGYTLVEISTYPIGIGEWIPFEQYLRANADFSNLLMVCEFPGNRRAQLVSDLVRFHYAANTPHELLYVDRDAYPISPNISGVAFAEYGIHAIDHCVFHSDDFAFFQNLMDALQRKFERRQERIQVYWPSVHALVNEVCLGKCNVIGVDAFHHFAKSRSAKWQTTT